VLVKNKAGKTPPGLGFFALPMPTWLGHILASVFLHQDLVFLHYQEKILARRPENWLDAVYTPNPQVSGSKTEPEGGFPGQLTVIPNYQPQSSINASFLMFGQLILKIVRFAKMLGKIYSV
jgi:hypothetical protein